MDSKDRLCLKKLISKEIFLLWYKIQMIEFLEASMTTLLMEMEVGNKETKKVFCSVLKMRMIL